MDDRLKELVFRALDRALGSDRSGARDCFDRRADHVAWDLLDDDDEIEGYVSRAFDAAESFEDVYKNEERVASEIENYIELWRAERGRS